MQILLIGGAGYIGSFLYQHLHTQGLSVDVCDTLLRGNPLGDPIRFQKDYQQLTTQELAPYTHVLWFAGHSSVGSSQADPVGALRNNCLGLFELTQKLPPGCRLIYASTASLYSTDQVCPESAQEDHFIAPSHNAYDISKFAFDYIADGFISNFIGLRMGTLCGNSPNLRRELIFNQMNLSAQQAGRVQVANPQHWRSLLFLDDLYQVVHRCIVLDDLPSGFFNVASVHASIGEIAQRIAAHHQVPVITLPDSATYSFVLDTRKSQQLLGVRYSTDLEQQCAAFMQQRSIL